MLQFTTPTAPDSAGLSAPGPPSPSTATRIACQTPDARSTARRTSSERTLSKSCDRRRTTPFSCQSWRTPRFGRQSNWPDLTRTVTRIELANGTPPPCGTTIEAVGYPETDLININLSRALVRPRADQGPPPDDSPTNEQKCLFIPPSSSASSGCRPARASSATASRRARRAPCGASGRCTDPRSCR